MIRTLAQWSRLAQLLYSFGSFLGFFFFASELKALVLIKHNTFEKKKTKSLNTRTSHQLMSTFHVITVMSGTVCI